MNNMNKWLIIGFGILFLILCSHLSIFKVAEFERAFIVRLGELSKTKEGSVKVLKPGLHWKIPFIDVVRLFDGRLNMTEVPSERIVTKEKETLLVDLFVQWRIQDYALFYNTTYGIKGDFDGSDRAEQLLRQTVKGIVHAAFGKRTLQNVVSEEREALMENIQVKANENIGAYGMEVVDVRINRVEFPKEVNEKVFARMNSERKRIAVRHRANGESKAAIISATADRVAQVTVAEARKEAERLRGEGDSRATKIYADSCNQAPEFYKFYRSLEAYKTIFKDKKDIFILKPDTEFLKYLKQGMVKE